MGYMFQGCVSLTALDLSNFDTTGSDLYNHVVIADAMFAGCSSLERLDISNFIVDANDRVDNIFDRCDNLKEIKTPKQVELSVKLPETDETYSWRTPDGTKVLELPAETTTVSNDKKIGISFIGDHFTLEEYPDKKEDIEVVLDKGDTKSFTFTIVPEEGYSTVPTIEIKSNLTKIVIAQGDTPYQYIVTPKDAGLGYVRDEIISIKVAEPEEHELVFPANWKSDFQDMVVVNGEELTALDSLSPVNKSVTVKVSNEFDTTIYTSHRYVAGKRFATEMEVVYKDAGPKIVKAEKYVSSPTETDLQYMEKGYSVLRLGKVYEDASIGSFYSHVQISLNLLTEGLPDGCHVIGYLQDYNDEGKYDEREYDEEIILYSYDDFYLQVKTDTPNAHRWYQTQISEETDGKWRVINPTTVKGIEGTVWKIDADRVQVNPVDRDILVDFNPYTIALDYHTGDIINLTAGDGAAVSENMKMIKVGSGDSLSVSFGLNDGLNLKGVSLLGKDGAALQSEGWLTLQDEGNNQWTITMSDMSKLYEIKKIHFNVEDEIGRVSLSDPKIRVVVSPDFGGEKIVYNGKPIYPKYGVSVSVNGVLLTKDTDYTVEYRNNVNAGTEAAIVIRAAEDSAKYRGEYTSHFTISKAESFNVPDMQLNIEAGTSWTNLSEQLAIDAPYGEIVKPTGYKLTYYFGSIFAATPTIEGDILYYTISKYANVDYSPARMQLRVTMQNYKSIEFFVDARLVERKALVLGGNLAEDKVYDGRETYPNLDKLEIVSVDGRNPSGGESAKILEDIKGTLTYHYTGIDGTVYDSFKPPVDVGSYSLQVRVSDENLYYKSDSSKYWLEAGTFKITPRDVVLTAKDVTLYLQDSLPQQYDYTVKGLAKDDALSIEPLLSCGIQNTENAGEYPIQINITGVRIAGSAGKDVTADYHITGEVGTLHVEAAKAGTYTVIYNLMGKDNDIRRSGFESGSLIPKPLDPTAAGYIFTGWYVDESFSKLWDFDTDTIQDNMILYAGWASDENADMELYVREILPQTYTGKAIKPAVTVYAADGKTLLKKNKDYKIAYKNNVDADTRKFSGKTIPDGGIGANASDTSQGFDAGLAYVVITGKGNYKGTVYMNFHINPVDISGINDANSGITLKYTEGFEAKSGKNAAIVTQFKIKTAKLKYKTDYTLTVKNAADGREAALTDKGQLPLNAGTYKLTIEGKDNYTGSIEKELYVASKEQLIKNAKIKCAPVISGVTKEQLQEGIAPQNLTVTINGVPLTEGQQYEVECRGNHAIGTAAVTVKGIGEYFGSKSITFSIKGTAFKEKEFGTVSVQDMTYTGTALTQNDVVLAKNGMNLVYGEDYTISYKNNIKKGKATMTFTARPSSGYSGSFKKTFTISPLNLDSENILLDGAKRQEGSANWTLSDSVPYKKGGATLAGELNLQLRATNALLREGRDYKIQYKDNQNVSKKTAYMILTGKGNYTGSVTVYFDIRKASLSELYQEKRVTITSKAVKVTFSYNRDEDLKDPDREFTPAVTVKDGKKTLVKNVDYKVTYKGNARRELEYGGTPQAVIIGIGNYSGTVGTQDRPITIPLSIYQGTLSNSRVYVVYDESTDYTYTGEAIKPKVSVYYGKASDISRAKRNKETDESLLTGEKQVSEEGEEGDEGEEEEEPSENAYGLTKLEEYVDGKGDYILSYGANTAKGKNGKVIIRGVYDYTGSVTSKFKIEPKEIYSIYEPDPEE